MYISAMRRRVEVLGFPSWSCYIVKQCLDLQMTVGGGCRILSRCRSPISDCWGAPSIWVFSLCGWRGESGETRDEYTGSVRLSVKFEAQFFTCRTAMT